MTTPNTQPDFENIARLITESRQRAFTKVNVELILLYYRVGAIVSGKVDEGSWGDKTVEELAGYIQNKIAGINGFNRRGLYRMKQFYETYAPASDCLNVWKEHKIKAGAGELPGRESGGKDENTIVSTVMTQLGATNDMFREFVSTALTQITWSHHLMILSKTKSPEEKLFYILTAIREKLSVRELERQLNTGLYERTVLSNRQIVAPQKDFPEGVFKDPYIFEFLDLPVIHSEADLEKALVQNLRKFILEIGKGFTYIGNQYRIQVGNKDYYTDLLFYHHDLRCLVMFELKIEEFKPEFIGKLNFYLEALDRDVKREDENASIGILLCKGKDTEVVEYALARNISPALVADYETHLIDKDTLRNKLHELTQALEKRNN